MRRLPFLRARLAAVLLAFAPVLALAGFAGLLAPSHARAEEAPFAGNKKSKTFHARDCKHAAKLQADNRVDLPSVEEAGKQGFTACKVCKPGGAAAAAVPDTSVIAAEGGDTFHAAGCAAAKQIKKKNRKSFATAADAQAAGLQACKQCKP